MVTKAIERAQNTVEQRNAEIRKNVLKYDEVMNEQRKVIYKRRDQILDGADLRDEAVELPRRGGRHARSRTYCVAEYAEEWDLEGLHAEIATLLADRRSPSSSSQACRTTDELYELLMDEATAYYEAREAELGAETMRQVERQVMLRIIDQRWREHLYEMDYLQEGINLRAMGQKDPLVEWQREGFEMFGAMMQGIAQDFVKYVMHVQVTVAEPKLDTPTPIGNLQYIGARPTRCEAPSTMAAAARAQAGAEGAGGRRPRRSRRSPRPRS